MKFPRNAKLFRGQLDAAPFAGVFFLLVIFLLLNSTLVFPPGIKIQLPQAGGSALPGLAGPSAVVAIDLNEQLYFENQVISDKELRARLITAARKHPQLTLILQADRGVRYEALFPLVRLAAEARIQEVFMASRPPVFPAKAEASRAP